MSDSNYPAALDHARASGFPSSFPHDEHPKLVTSRRAGAFERPLERRSSRDVIRALEAAGWVCVRTRGAHHHLKHPQNPSIVTVSHPRRDVGIGMLKKIERISGLRLT